MRPRHSSSVERWHYTLAACARGSTYHIQTTYPYAGSRVWTRAHSTWWTWWCLCHARFHLRSSPKGGGYSIHRAKRRAYALVALLYRDRFLLQLQLHKRIKFVLLVALVQRHVSAKSEFYMTFSATRKSEARNGSTGRTDTQTDRRTDGHVQGLMRPAGGCIITYC